MADEEFADTFLQREKARIKILSKTIQCLRRNLRCRSFSTAILLRSHGRICVLRSPSTADLGFFDGGGVIMRDGYPDVWRILLAGPWLFINYISLRPFACHFLDYI